MLGWISAFWVGKNKKLPFRKMGQDHSQLRMRLLLGQRRKCTEIVHWKLHLGLLISAYLLWQNGQPPVFHFQPQSRIPSGHPDGVPLLWVPEPQGLRTPLWGLPVRWTSPHDCWKKSEWLIDGGMDSYFCGTAIVKKPSWRANHTRGNTWLQYLMRLTIYGQQMGQHSCKHRTLKNATSRMVGIWNFPSGTYTLKGSLENSADNALSTGTKFDMWSSQLSEFSSDLQNCRPDRWEAGFMADHMSAFSAVMVSHWSFSDP